MSDLSRATAMKCPHCRGLYSPNDGGCECQDRPQAQGASDELMEVLRGIGKVWDEEYKERRES